MAPVVEQSVAEQIAQAFGIMVLGMGLVFIFLSLLIVGINLVAKWCAEDAKAQTSPSRNQVKAEVSNPSVIEPKVLAAITTAIHQYRAQT